MAEYQNLQATINAVIKANGVQAITGPVLNAVLNSMVTVLGDGYRFGGVAAPADNPGSPDNRVAYLAAQDGTYTNFGGLALSGEVALLCWDAAWTKQTLFTIDAAPTPGSDNLISSGAVDTALTNLANSIAAAYMQLVPAAVEDNLASYDNAGQVKDSGIAAGDVVLKGGAYLGLFAGYAANLVDTRSAGTPQGPYAFRQSGGDGVDYMVRIKGKTEAFNQLLTPHDQSGTERNGITLTINADGSLTFDGTATAAAEFYFAGEHLVPAGHKALILRTMNTKVLVSGYGPSYGAWNVTGFSQTESCLVTSVGELYRFEVRILNGTVCDNEKVFINLFDLTLMFGAGNEPATVAAFESLHPLPYYNYNAGVLKNNAATGIKTRGFNQWDEVWESGTIDSNGDPYPNANQIRSKNFIPAFPSTTYYVKSNTGTGVQVFEYDSAHNYITRGFVNNTTITTNAATRYLKFRTPDGTTTYNHDICINLSNASRNGTYEPYWERTLALGLNSLACHDENNNAVTLNGLDGVGTSYDEAVVENGLVTKIIKRFAEVDLGSLTYSNIQDSTSIFRASLADYKPSANINSVNAKYQTTADNVNFYSTAADIAAIPDKSSIKYYVSGAPSNQICFKDTAYTDAATFKTAMTGVKLRYELATPKVLTVDTPFPAFVEVDNLGTQERLPADTAADPQGGFESDSNYSVSTANLVRALGL